jgi:hypothetical protein
VWHVTAADDLLVFYNDAPSFNRFTAILEAGVWHFRRNVAGVVAGGC